MIYYLSLHKDIPHKDYWDYGILYDIFKYINLEQTVVNKLPITNFGIVVLPAKGHANFISEVNEQINNIDNLILFLMSDEESKFPVEQIKHKNIKIYIQYPNPELHKEYRKIPVGYPAHLHTYCPSNIPTKGNDYFFAGQVTHERRVDLVENLKGKPYGVIVQSKRFGAGIEPVEYIKQMSNSKVVPAPSGPVHPDSFRLSEALELGCVPIADNETPKNDWSGFWDWLFNDSVPFPTINDYSDITGYIDDCVKEYPVLNNKVQAWWLRYKNKFRETLIKDIEELTENSYTMSDVSVVVPISPIKSHPNIEILEETLNSVIHHLPNAQIYLTFDGVREEQKELTKDYNESIRRTLWKFKNYNIIPYIFDTHKHQVGMFRDIIDNIKTSTILYIEQDTPLVIDYEIPLNKLKEVIKNGESNLIRFHFEAHIPEPHKHLMLEQKDELLETVQWSQRPHLASTAFYKRILSEQFSKKAKCFIEDLVHGKVIEDYKKYGMQGWNQWRLHIYHPEGNIKRSYHTDGREGANKYDDKQTF